MARSQQDQDHTPSKSPRAVVISGASTGMGKATALHLNTLGYLVFGVVAGGISLWVFPSYLMANPQWRVFNAACTPVAAGLCVAALGAWRERRGQTVLRIDKFAYGYLFALAFGLVRFWFAH